ncbi:MAG: DUF1543 domain-containing protein [Chitinophagaceae bacterium]|nr:DUF1543 domain-containing protein [Chitinophagaceae bacterium]
MKLFMVLIGCKPEGRHTEQHDIFFGIAQTLADLVPQLKSFWPGKQRLHIDAWREVTMVGQFNIRIVPAKKKGTSKTAAPQLFFLNLGGYRPGEFEEYHYKLIEVAPDLATAIRSAKQTAFYKHTGFKGATSHVDDKYGIDIDDSYLVEDLLSAELREKYHIQITPGRKATADEWHIGYTKLSSLTKL